MPHMTTYVLSGLIASYAAAFLPGNDDTNLVRGARTDVDRSYKSDRLDTGLPGQKRPVNVVALEFESIGNSTIVIRPPRTAPAPQPVGPRVGSVQPNSGIWPSEPITMPSRPAVRPKPLIGCDPMISPLAAPSDPVIPGRCMASLPDAGPLVIASVD